ncbi:MAG: leucine/isoleucine/valine transporter permease subunit [Acidimicrobiia bacterium]|nr:leucine/isoleucine/valine transporter permease subunit [Acidimicrobiia bacterium]MXY73680.1 leucine/isoleucine/valine transporter permease subunit [Acidimicrobiia bacterium]MYA38694.1 leucine/isoleucine/valine transporter permease subunit [Acidimicrobiia bacterium]MYB78184.1 leucine/isoleucine/valine transporter permease subunit [Acidimicrobiia bacterium]MYK56379.1 leucine/isoleucine/valine transporter permease subunit [Acidimicrobiia bacterium]
MSATVLSPLLRHVSGTWRRVLRLGTLGAVGQVFISLSGMPVRLDVREIIVPILSLGYLAVLAVPIVLGVLLGRRPEHQEFLEKSPNRRDLLLGATLGGLMGGGGLSVLALLLARFDLRDPLINWSPQLLEFLSFGRGVSFGFVIWLVIGGGLGLVGGTVRLASARTQRVIMTMALTVVGAAILESLLVDLVEGVGLEALVEWLYAPRGGLTLVGAAVLAFVSGLLSLLGQGRVKNFREKIQTMEGPRQTRVNLMLIAAVGVALIVLPLLVGKLTNELLANIGLFVLLALGLNIVVGLAGILDLGYVAFFAVGSYSTAVLTAATSPRIAPEFPWFFALIIVVFIAILVGLFIGAPVIRMRGDYLAIVTLGFGEIIRLLFLSDWLSGWFGGSQGITAIDGVDVFGLLTVDGTNPRRVFYLVLFFCAIAIYISWRLERSRLGRAWMAVREDEPVAEAMGINTVNVKLMAFVVGAVLGSFGGAIFVAKVGSVFPTSFLILVSIIILVVVIFGGMGNIFGVIAGAVVLIGVLGGPKQPGLLVEFSEFKLLIYGALLVWMMLARPEGLIPSARRSRELHQEEFLQDAWLTGQIDTDDTNDLHGGSRPPGSQA